MSRAKFPKEKQKLFLNTVKQKSGLPWYILAQMCNVSMRSLSDWRREKLTADYHAILVLSRRFKIPTGKVEKLNNYWYIEKSAPMGGLARVKLYGPPGTTWGRQKGGRISQQRRREDPEKYAKLGCITRKVFARVKRSLLSAELIGIILGDGGLTSSQLTITLHKVDDRLYARFVSSLMTGVLGERPSWHEHKNIIRLIISGVGLVVRLEQLGLKRGNKVLQQVEIPLWIQSNPLFLKACLRGLFDTDGGFYIHRRGPHRIHKAFGFCFTNHSFPLVNVFYESLLALGVRVKKTTSNKIYIYNFPDIQKFMNVIGSNNPKHTNKLKRYALIRKV